MKIAYLSFPGHGHVNPTLPIIKALVGRGHDITYFSTEDFRHNIELLGIQFSSYPLYDFFKDVNLESSLRILSESMEKNDPLNKGFITLLISSLKHITPLMPEYIIFKFLEYNIPPKNLYLAFSFLNSHVQKNWFANSFQEYNFDIIMTDTMLAGFISLISNHLNVPLICTHPFFTNMPKLPFRLTIEGHLGNITSYDESIDRMVNGAESCNSIVSFIPKGLVDFGKEEFSVISLDKGEQYSLFLDTLKFSAFQRAPASPRERWDIFRNKGPF